MKSEISQIGKEKYCMTSLIFGIYKMEKINHRQAESVTDTKNKQIVARGKEEGTGQKLVREFKRHNLPVTK